jgi:hypothetical protein
MSQAAPDPWSWYLAIVSVDATSSSEPPLLHERVHTEFAVPVHEPTQLAQTEPIHEQLAQTAHALHDPELPDPELPIREPVPLDSAPDTTIVAHLPWRPPRLHTSTNTSTHLSTGTNAHTTSPLATSSSIPLGPLGSLGPLGQLGSLGSLGPLGSQRLGLIVPAVPRFRVQVVLLRVDTQSRAHTLVFEAEEAPSVLPCCFVHHPASHHSATHHSATHHSASHHSASHHSATHHSAHQPDSVYLPAHGTERIVYFGMESEAMHHESRALASGQPLRRITAADMDPAYGFVRLDRTWVAFAMQSTHFNWTNRTNRTNRAHQANRFALGTRHGIPQTPRVRVRAPEVRVRAPEVRVRAPEVSVRTQQPPRVQLETPLETNAQTEPIHEDVFE